MFLRKIRYFKSDKNISYKIEEGQDCWKIIFWETGFPNKEKIEFVPYDKVPKYVNLYLLRDKNLEYGEYLAEKIIK